MRTILSALLTTSLLAGTAAAQDGAIRPDQAEFRGLYKELVETNTTLSAGNCTLAAERMAARLKAAGMQDDQLKVLFTSDHGDLLGDRRLMFKGGLHYGGLTRVPFIWSDPATSGASASLVPRETPALAQTMDIAATVLARAGLEPAHGMQGQSLLPLVSGQADALRSSVLIEEEGQRLDFGLGQRIRMRTLRTSDHRITLYDGQPWGELCDLRSDPLELRNLWNDPASQALRSQLMAELAYAMVRQTNTSPYPLASA